MCILWEKILGHFLTQELCTFLKSVQIADFFIPLATFFKLIMFKLLKGVVLLFLEDKRSNRQETVQHFRKLFIYKLVRISMGTQNHLTHSDFPEFFQNHWTLLSTKFGLPTKL